MPRGCTFPAPCTQYGGLRFPYTTKGGKKCCKKSTSYNKEVVDEYYSEGKRYYVYQLQKKKGNGYKLGPAEMVLFQGKKGDSLVFLRRPYGSQNKLILKEKSDNNGGGEVVVAAGNGDVFYMDFFGGRLSRADRVKARDMMTAHLK